MPAHFELSDPALNRQFLRFQQPEPRSGQAARSLARALLAEAAIHRRHGDIGAALAAEGDALRMARVAARKAVQA
jgi:hypothetical protein